MASSVSDYTELSISERIQLVEDIWDSIAEEAQNNLQLSTEESNELHRRLAAHQADPSSGLPWEQVRATLFEAQHVIQ